MKSTATNSYVVRWRRVLVDPARLWIRFVPRDWPWPQNPCVDLRKPTLHQVGRPIPDPVPFEAEWNGLNDVVWVPPVDAGWRSARAALIQRLSELDIPRLDHRLLGDDSSGADASTVIDVMELLLSGAVDGLARTPAERWVLWPLIPGMTDRPDLIERGLKLLRDAGVRGVHGVALELTARQRRALAEQGGEGAFDSLFHGTRSSERTFAVQVHEAGLEVFFPRPVSGTPRLSGNRGLAASLHRAGQLWGSLGRSPVQGEAFLAAARRIDDSSHDMRRLIQEGNLGIVDWLTPEARALLRAAVRDPGAPDSLAELEREYVEATR